MIHDSVQNQITNSRAILVALRELLATIDRLNGYNFNIGSESVTLNPRKYLKGNDGKNEPLLLIVPRHTFYSYLSNCRMITGTTGGQKLDDGWEIDIYCYLQLSDEVDEDGAIVLRLEDLLDDVIKRVVNASLDIDDVMPIVIAGKTARFNNDKNAGEGIVTIKVQYEFGYTTA